MPVGGPRFCGLKVPAVQSSGGQETILEDLSKNPDLQLQPVVLISYANVRICYHHDLSP
jgi:hypothetical protein